MKPRPRYWLRRDYSRHLGHAPSLWFGFAYRLPHVDADVCYPIPLNIVVGLAHRAWLWVRFPFRNPSLLERSFNMGVRYGERYERKRRAAMKIIERR